MAETVLEVPVTNHSGREAQNGNGKLAAFAKAHNWRKWGSWAGPTSFAALFRHEDGLAGTAANLARYAVQSLQVLSPTDLAGRT